MHELQLQTKGAAAVAEVSRGRTRTAVTGEEGRKEASIYEVRTRGRGGGVPKKQTKVQGDHSGCDKPPVDIKTHVPFWPSLP